MRPVAQEWECATEYFVLMSIEPYWVYISHTAVPFMWGSLRLAAIIIIMVKIWSIQFCNWLHDEPWELIITSMFVGAPYWAELCNSVFMFQNVAFRRQGSNIMTGQEYIVISSPCNMFSLSISSIENSHAGSYTCALHGTTLMDNINIQIRCNDCAKLSLYFNTVVFILGDHSKSANQIKWVPLAYKQGWWALPFLLPQMVYMWLHLCVCSFTESDLSSPSYDDTYYSDTAMVAGRWPAFLNCIVT